MIRLLSGKQVKTNDSLVDFGDGNQFGDITIRDIAGNNIIKININIYFDKNNTQPSFSLHQLRDPVPDFVGRKEEIDNLVRILTSDEKHQTIAISGIRGLGGIGKTELAYAAAKNLLPIFCDAQLIIELRGASDSPLPPEQALQTLIRAFERDTKLPDSIEDLQKLYRSLLTNKRVLIIADDAYDAAQVRPLLPPAGCALLITSRRRFTLPGMIALNLETLSPTSAMNLLLRICPRIDIHAPLLASRCGHLPLALRVSASILANDDSLNIEEFLFSLTIERERLKYLRDPDDPSQDVEATLNLSFSILPSEVKGVLSQSSIFPLSFNKDATKEVILVSNTSKVMEHLSFLIRRSLIEWNETTERYNLHDLVRALAISHLENEENTRIRHSTYFLKVATNINEMYKQGGDTLLSGLILFDMERANIEASIDWLQQKLDDLKLCRVLVKYHDELIYVAALRFDRNRKLIPWLEKTLESSRFLTDKYAEAKILKSLGGIYYGLGQLQKAEGYYFSQLQIAEDLGQIDLEASALNRLGAVYVATGEYRQAIEFIERSLKIYKSNGDVRSEGLALGNLGLAVQGLGELSRGIELYTRQLAVARELKDFQRECHILGLFGFVLTAKGEIRNAINYFLQSLNMSIQLGDNQLEANALGGIGLAYETAGNISVAIEYYTRRLDVIRKINDRRGEGFCLARLGAAYAHLSMFDKAETCLSLARTILVDMNARSGDGVLAACTACYYRERSLFTESEAQYNQALSIFKEIGERDRAAECRIDYAKMLRRQGRLKDSVEQAILALDFYQECDATARIRQIHALINGEDLPVIDSE